jgi:hypothetical protein
VEFPSPLCLSKFAQTACMFCTNISIKTDLCGLLDKDPKPQRKMTSIQVTVYENGKEYDQTLYSGNELVALAEQIEAIWNFGGTATNWFEVENDETLVIKYKDEMGRYKPIPEALLKRTYRNTYTPEPADILGTVFRIEPRKLGVSPWPKDVRVKFTLVENEFHSSTTETPTQNVSEANCT